MNTTVWCTTRFQALHSWKGAPDECSWLRNEHLHTFFVRAEVRVTHDDRDVEFILLSREIDEHIARTLDGLAPDWSCEMWASGVAAYLDGKGRSVVSVSVSEEGIYGATVTYDS